MSDDLEAKQGRRAEVLCNRDFICVETYSGRGLLARDPQGAQHLLPSDAPDDALGSAVMDALTHSRFLSLEEYRLFFDHKKTQERYAAWVTRLMKQYGYRNKRALFADMKNCAIECRDPTIIIRPTHHEKLEAWSGEGISESDYVVISAGSDPAALGAALRTGLRRCT